MKLVIISDIHGNYDAWSALPEEYDELWVLGDLVNYGPQPKEVFEEVTQKASLIVRGNHDHAVGHEDDSKWSSRYRPIAEATRRYTSSVLNDEQKAYLRNLPLKLEVERKGVRFNLTHGTPSDPLYGRLPPDADEWVAEIENLSADVVLVGHTHIPFIRNIDDKILLNPGSLGQPRGGGALARYAVWQDGRFELRSFPYPVDTTVKKLKALVFPPHVETDLVCILRAGSA